MPDEEASPPTRLERFLAVSYVLLPLVRYIGVGLAGIGLALGQIGRLSTSGHWLFGAGVLLAAIASLLQWRIGIWGRRRYGVDKRDEN